MLKRTAIWVALVAAHLGAGAWGWSGTNDRVAAIVAGTIYLPLWPLDRIGVPVFGATGWTFPAVTAVGWSCVVVLWLVAYWYLAALLARLGSARRRVD
jgi:cation transporter-like permease